MSKSTIQRVLIAAMGVCAAARVASAAIVVPNQTPFFAIANQAGTFDVCRFSSTRPGSPPPRAKDFSVSVDWDNNGSFEDGPFNSTKQGKNTFFGRRAHTFSACGVFTVECHVEDKKSTDTADITNTVTVTGTETAPVVTLSEVCPAVGATGLTATAASGSGFDWSIADQNGNSLAFSGQGTNQITFAAGLPGANMVVSLLATGTGGCQTVPAVKVAQVDFLDVGPSHPAHAAVCTFAGNRLTDGCTADGQSFCPDDAVTREEAAYLLMRTGHRNDNPPFDPVPAGDVYTDVPDTDPGGGYDEALWSEGIGTGCVAPQGTPPTPTVLGTFCPTQSVPREQLAIYLANAAGLPIVACAAPGPFSDVPDTSPYCPYIDALDVAGFTAGCFDDGLGTRNFCPSDAVRRDQLVSMLVAIYAVPALTP